MPLKLVLGSVETLDVCLVAMLSVALVIQGQYLQDPGSLRQVCVVFQFCQFRPKGAVDNYIDRAKFAFFLVFVPECLIKIMTRIVLVACRFWCKRKTKRKRVSGSVPLG